MSTKIDAQSTISKTFGINSSAAWDVVSTDDDHNLVMVHHKPEADLNEYGQLRGVVVDTNAETVVCKSFEHAPIVDADFLKITDGKINLTDEFGTEYNLNLDEISIHPGFEGTLMHVFKHGDKVFRTTRKRIDPSRSRWGSSKPFTEMYEELNGPTDEELFDNNAMYSPYCHVFIIVHPDVLVVSKTNIGKGYLVYLGTKQMWSLEYNECPYKQLQSSGDFYGNVTEEEFEADKRPNAGWIDETLYIPKLSETLLALPSFNVDQANKHLKFGFYDELENIQTIDQRILPGEFIIIHKYNEKGEIEKMLRVESNAYAWRSKMRDNNPNTLYRFYQLIHRSNLEYGTDTDKTKYNNLFPLFTPYDEKTIQNYEGQFVIWPQHKDIHQDNDYIPQNRILYTKDNRIYNIWLAFLNSVPLHKQKEVSTYLDHFVNNRDEVVGWIRQIENIRNLDQSLFSKRTLDIISSARRFAKKPMKTRNGKFLSHKQKTKNIIRNFLMKEEGHSLYKLIREMNKYKLSQE